MVQQKTTPQQARSILTSTPQIAYALVALMVKMNAVDVQVLQVRAFIHRMSFHRRLVGLGPPSLIPNVLARRKRSLCILRPCHRRLRSHLLSSHQLPRYLHTFLNIVPLPRRHIHPLTITATLTRLNHQIKCHTWHKDRANMLVLAASERHLPRLHR